MSDPHRRVLGQYPTYVWSPAGGWWNNDRPDWQRNTAVAAGVIAVLGAGLFYVSTSNERRYRLPDRPIWSQRWAAHTLDDDPDYYAKLAAYEATKRSFWSRVWPDDEHH